MTSTVALSANAAESAWSFRAGHLALDFANTMDWHASDHPEELLNSYTDLVNWASDFSLLTPEEARSLSAEAERRPEAAAKTLKAAIALRESLYRIFSSIAHEGQPGVADLAELKALWGRAVAAAQIVPHEKGFAWAWTGGPPDLERMLWPVARAAVDLLLSETLSQVGQCADDRGCGMLFIDTSRNHSRQWCRMDSCGNRAKAQRHYHRRIKSP
jgi:predicted RNA-binding Zn ribbon-like protein